MGSDFEALKTLWMPHYNCAIVVQYPTKTFRNLHLQVGFLRVKILPIGTYCNELCYKAGSVLIWLKAVSKLLH